MIHALRPFRSLPLSLHPPHIPAKASALRFRTTTAMATEEAKQQDSEKTGDIMSHSFGEGYATRSEEEGFGGIYGGNQSIAEREGERETIGENHPEYDKTQGSEVKEKEKGRHQTDGSG